MNKVIAIVFSLGLMLCSCQQESMEEKAEREAKDYTRKYCPTPVINSTSTDSITFKSSTRTFTYHVTFSGILDDEALINEHVKEISDNLQASIKESTNMKAYVEGGFHFQYICRSQKDKNKVLLTTKF